MPTINLNDNQTSSQSQPQPPVVSNTQAQTPSAKPQPQNTWNDWNDPWQDDSGTSNPSPTTQAKRLTPQERVEMIEKVYLEILGRNPDTRDINYYKYSTLSEDEIKKQLLTGNEHKQLLADGRDYKKVKERALQAETRVKMLEGQIVDQVEEFKQLTNLLKEKNSYIGELREKLNQNGKSSAFTPQTFVTKEEKIEEAKVHFASQTQLPKVEPKESVVEKFRKKLKDLL